MLIINNWYSETKKKELNSCSFNSFIVKSRGGKDILYQEATPYRVILKEGEHVEIHLTSDNPETVTVKIEVQNLNTLNSCNVLTRICFHLKTGTIFLSFFWTPFVQQDLQLYIQKTKKWWRLLFLLKFNSYLFDAKSNWLEYETWPWNFFSFTKFQNKTVLRRCWERAIGVASTGSPDAL